MSDNIPFEIQIEIMKKLPIKSLIQFRSVSKSWKSLIDSSDFIAHYRTHMQHLLVSYTVDHSFDRQYVSFIDDDTFPQHSVSFHLHSFINNLYYTSIINITHGLICLYWRYVEDSENNIIYEKDMAVIWNPIIRKAVVVIVPKVARDTYHTVIGFGVCRETNDPKIVKLLRLEKYRWRVDRKRLMSSIPWQVEVFTLSTGAWRRVCNNLPRKSIRFSCDSEVVDGVLYWLADDVDPGFGICNMIMSFDLTTEEFKEVKLPDSLARPDKKLLISKRRESLIVLDYDEDEVELDFYDVWMMEDGISKSFTKLFSVNGEMYPLASIHGFRKSGEPVFEVSEGDECGELVVYEPYSEHFDKLGINVTRRAFTVSPYVETLLLLDKPDLTVYYENQIFKYRDDLFQELNLAPVDR
ncbi:hypothetical protein QVD17_35336 [Tagetes erecta]|uniref:F-box domain-containing protein n=1 Tax=Tagetes erecta TaxID=13708 RepID=A0AAD8K3B4_TARER|nr:hypothetical protein QVD17_35336 [Tagetes erecta]